MDVVDQESIITQQFRLETKVRSGAGWLLFVGLASAVNSMVLSTGGKWNLLVGLGITQVAAVFAHKGFLNPGAVVFVSICIGLIFGFLSLFARRQYIWAFVVGMLLYALDGLVFLALKDWLSLAFHGFAIYWMFQGLQSVRALRRLRASAPILPIRVVENEAGTVMAVVVDTPAAETLFSRAQHQQMFGFLRRAGIAVGITLAFMGLFTLILFLQ